MLFEARKLGLAGCTVLRGIMSFGASSHIHTAKLIEISQDLPIIIEVVGRDDKINAFAEVVGLLPERWAAGIDNC
ncbi:DUF190 domain-containing protein [Parafilimonas sp.]|uniref:DUF190 domain-containing protein n=1 Tax=Parafilimonas sp. TaxID=1969739 RepID=UPI0039E4549C